MLKLFFTFFKIGLFTFGGGYAMIPLISEEITEFGISQYELSDFIAISESTPGPFAINISTFVGLRVNGVIGSICSTIGVILTSFILILIIAKCFEKFKENKIVKYCMFGLKPAVVALIGTAIITTASAVFFPNGNVLETIQTIEFIKGIIIFAISTILVFKKVHPIKIILIAALLGILVGFI